MTSSHDAFQALHGSLSDLELAIIRWAEAYNMTNDRLEELAAALARLALLKRPAVNVLPQTSRLASSRLRERVGQGRRGS